MLGIGQPTGKVGVTIGTRRSDREAGEHRLAVGLLLQDRAMRRAANPASSVTGVYA